MFNQIHVVRVVAFWLLVSCAWPTLAQEVAATQPAETKKAFDDIAPSPALARIIESPALDKQTLRNLRLFHGQWEGLTAENTTEAAILAWMQYHVDDPALQDEAVEPTLRARAALFKGDTTAVLALLANEESIRATLLRAQAHEQSGDLAQAVAELKPLRDKFQHDTVDDASELTAAAQAIVMLAYLEGRPSQDYQLALGMLSRVTQELDPLYWPAHLAEAELLLTKDNRKEAFEALQDTLSLNPNAGMAWYWLGRLSSEGYNFDAAVEASGRLRLINPQHPLANEVAIRSWLRQRDVASARSLVDTALLKFPQRRQLLALDAATHGMAYQEVPMRDAMDRFDQVAPGSPLALYTAGEFLATDRQYEPAEKLLRMAIDRSPNWPAPRLELGLLLMQAGNLPAARTELTHAARLDPFHKAVNNQLRLVENLLDIYRTIETDHFIIRYKPGIDEVLARDMPGPLEEMYEEIAAIFQHRPDVKTQIDIMPDKSNFAVRITGMPDIWTIAAATGDVISITPPRSGSDQADPYNWVNVMRHEYVHTVTLSQTRNRVPHWFTEACAVSVETTGRTYDTCQLLAWALTNDGLFDYDKINWGFVRPKTPRDRPLAYAQSDWMLEFIATRWSHQAIVDLLNLYREGVSDTDALKRVTGYEADAFMAEFKAWAFKQVKDWGFPNPYEGPQKEAEVREGLADQSVEKLEETAETSSGMVKAMALKLIAERKLEGFAAGEEQRWIRRYAESRPVDPWPFKVLALMALESDTPDIAVGPLQKLEKSDNYSSVWSHKLATLHREAGRLDEAQRAMTRAMNVEPYNASFRELAATIALQRKDLEAAAYQVEALEILEPDRAIHPTRLAVIYDRLSRPDDAKAAATRARELNPNANVGRFLDE